MRDCSLRWFSTKKVTKTTNARRKAQTCTQTHLADGPPWMAADNRHVFFATGLSLESSFKPPPADKAAPYSGHEFASLARVRVRTHGVNSSARGLHVAGGMFGNP